MAGGWVLDSVTRARLVEQHLPLARGLARRHLGAGEALEDLVQVGALGLVAAARRYDPARGVPFAAFAAPTVDGELRRHLRDRGSTVRVPRREQALAGLLRRVGAATSQRLGHEASLAELAEAAGVTRRQAELVLGGTAGAAPLSLLEEAASETASEQIEACERRVLLRPAFAALDADERQALALRFAADFSQSEIALRMHISQSRASRLLRGALEKIRAALDE
jgi:RNA polymerase sigma-B factor